MKQYKLNGQSKDMKKKRKYNKEVREALKNNPMAIVFHFKDGTSDVCGCNPYGKLK